MLILYSSEFPSEIPRIQKRNFPNTNTMYKKLISILVLLITFSNCIEKKSCTDFKTGNFIYVSKNQPEKITRTDSMQIETNPETGVIIKSLIEWTSECNYVLTHKEILNYPGDVSQRIGQKVYVKILEIKGNEIKVHAKSESIDTEIKFLKTE